jgi:hypothetical protein
MLAVQEYLQSNSVESLESIGVFAKYSKDFKYVILDYDQVEASKFKENIIVKECRGLVLRTDDFSIVQKAFNRFFNLNEGSCSEIFDWSNFGTSTKEDGSLIKVRWYLGDWFVTTRNSFADTHVGDAGQTWEEVVLGCLNSFQKDMIQLYPQHCFVFELCSPHNTVVVNHPEPKLVLLGLFDCTDGAEQNIDNFTMFSDAFNRPTTFNFKSLDDIIAYLDALEESKDDTEGVVIKDCNGVRLKAKSKWYLKLHKLSNNGNIARQDNLLDIILTGEVEEILSYFPYLKEQILSLEEKLNTLFDELVLVWETSRPIENQKEFALTIIPQTKFSKILFDLKKDKGTGSTLHDLHHVWVKNRKMVIEHFE